MGRSKQALAVGLSLLAGFVDGMGYLALGGVFVAFMSGNSTVMGVGAAEGVGARTALAVGLVAAFVAGVAAGTALGRAAGVRRIPALLAAMAAVLALAGLVQWGGWPRAAGVLAALAMGMENTAFQEPGKPGIGLTYMTGTLVRIGQRLAERRGDGLGFDLLLWAGMVGGAALGAWTYGRIGLGGLFVAAAALLAGAGALWRRGAAAVS